MSGNLTIYIPNQLVTDIRKAALNRRMTLKELFRQALTAELQRCEETNGGPFDDRRGEIRRGRPVALERPADQPINVVTGTGIDPALHEAVRNAAWWRKESVSAFCRRALELYLEDTSDTKTGRDEDQKSAAQS